MGRPKGSKNKTETVTEQPVVEAPMPDTFGIVLIATGHPYYIHMACNLARSIKWHDTKIPITLIHDGVSVNMMADESRQFFDTIKQAPDEMLAIGDPFYLKLCLDYLTDYSRTLYLDVDMICTARKPFGEFIDSLKGIPFTIANRGRLTSGAMRSQWIGLQDIKDAYNVEGIYDVSSEVIYFEQPCKVFARAREVYEQNFLQVGKFGSGYPDEPFISIAMELLGVAPHMAPYEPSYWQPHYFQKYHGSEYVNEKYYLLSVGGNDFIRQVKSHYDILSSHYYYRTGGKAKPYQLIPKRSIMKERRKI